LYLVGDLGTRIGLIVKWLSIFFLLFHSSGKQNKLRKSGEFGKTREKLEKIGKFREKSGKIGEN
jgi:hypothetical protein